MAEPEKSPPNATLKSDGNASKASEATKRDLTVHDVFKQLKIPDAAKFVMGCLAILAAAYSLGAAHPFSGVYSVPQLTADAQPIESKTYYGYFGDFKTDGSPTISDE